MKLTSLLYTAYTEILTEILSSLASDTLDHGQLYTLIQNKTEKIIPLSIPTLLANSPFSPSDGSQPPYLEHLKETWMATILSDIRLSLLVPHNTLSKIQHNLAGLNPLFDPSELDTFRPLNGDPFTDKTYRQIMQTLLDARQNRQIVRLLYVQDIPCASENSGSRVMGSFLPLRIEYDPSTDRFHILIQKIESGSPISTLSLGIVHIIDARYTAKTTPSPPPLTSIPSLFEDYLLVPPPEPLLLEVPGNRTLFEHFQRVFAGIDLRTQYDGPSHIYTCMLSYKPQDEDSIITLLTDLDPSIHILSPSRIARQVRTNRLRRQELAGRLKQPSILSK